MHVVALSDQDGEFVEFYEYDAYGAVTVFDSAGVELADGSVAGNDHFFTGRRYDRDLDLYYYRNRWYDPHTGRFLSRDPLGLWGDSLNLGNGMGYVGQSPWNYVDPLGLQTMCQRIADWSDRTLWNPARNYIASPNSNVIVGSVGFAAVSVGEGLTDALRLGTTAGETVGDPDSTAWDYASAAVTEGGRVLTLVDPLSSGKKQLSGMAKNAVSGRGDDILEAVSDTAKVAGGGVAKASDDVIDVVKDTKQRIRTSREARRKAMRDAGIPHSHQPVSQQSPRAGGTPVGRQLDYEVPNSVGGGTQNMSDNTHLPIMCPDTIRIGRQEMSKLTDKLILRGARDLTTKSAKLMNSEILNRRNMQERKCAMNDDQKQRRLLLSTLNALRVKQERSESEFRELKNSLSQARISLLPPRDIYEKRLEFSRKRPASPMLTSAVFC